MAAVVRNFRLTGNTIDPTVAIVTINGAEVFNGSVEIASPPPVTSPPTLVPMIYGDYNGDSTESQTLAVEITVVSGAARFGVMEINCDAAPPNDWASPEQLPNSGRANILINGAAPSWPSDEGPTVPDGTPGDPDWGGWAFSLNPGDVLTFDYTAMPFVVSPG